MANPAQSDINGVYSPFSPCDHILPSIDQCAFETLLSPIRFVLSCYLFVSTAWVFAIPQLESQWTAGVSSQVWKHRLSCLSVLDNFTSCSTWTTFIFSPSLSYSPQLAFLVMSFCDQARVCIHKFCYKRWWDACSWCAACQLATRSSQSLLP